MSDSSEKKPDGLPGNGSDSSHKAPQTPPEGLIRQAGVEPSGTVEKSFTIPNSKVEESAKKS